MDTHVIQKRDLLEMLSRFGDDNKIVVDAGGAVLYIDNAEYSGGSISIKCHNDIEDEREDLEDTIENLRQQLSKAARNLDYALALDWDTKKDDIFKTIRSVKEELA